MCRFRAQHSGTGRQPCCPPATTGLRMGVRPLRECGQMPYSWRPGEPRFLIVDDDPIVRRCMSRLIRPRGQVVLAETAHEDTARGHRLAPLGGSGYRPAKPRVGVSSRSDSSWGRRKRSRSHRRPIHSWGPLRQEARSRCLLLRRRRACMRAPASKGTRRPGSGRSRTMPACPPGSTSRCPGYRGPGRKRRRPRT
jgi:hypothetical protein